MGVFQHWPNRITAMRFLGALALFAILAWLGDRDAASLTQDRVAVQLAFWVFVVTASSDFVDGWLARRDNHITAFGRIADPFVDKVLVMGAMVFLAVLPWSKNLVPAWIVVVILAREFLVTAIRGYVESLGRQFPADWFGKIKMIVQCIAVGTVIGLYAFPWPPEIFSMLEKLGVLSVWATLLASLVSCFTYLFKTRQMLLESSS